MKPSPAPVWFIAAAGLLLAACNFDTPLTPAPTQKIDARLLGNWAAVDRDATKEEIMSVRQWDETTYAVALDDDIYRVYHSDFAGVAFVSVQDLNSKDRQYCYYRWALSADGRTLTLQGLSDKLFPGKTMTAAAIQKVIKDNAANPALFDKELRFTRKKPK